MEQTSLACKMGSLIQHDSAVICAGKEQKKKKKISEISKVGKKEL